MLEASRQQHYTRPTRSLELCLVVNPILVTRRQHREYRPSFVRKSKGNVESGASLQLKQMGPLNKQG